MLIFCRTGVKERVSVPVYIGSGITAQNLHHYKAGKQTRFKILLKYGGA